MKNIGQVIQKYKIYILALLVVFAGFATIELINKRFWLHDFQVYYDAATAFFLGNTVYCVSFGLSSGYYKYSPFALFIFFPFTLIPFAISKVIYFTFLSLLIISTVIFSNKLIIKNLFFQSKQPSQNLILFLITIAFLQHIYFELHLGNINILLLFFILIGLHFILNKKQWIGGLFIALAILIKPHFIILIPLFLFRKQFISLASCLAALFFGLLIPSVYIGFKANTALLLQWKNAMMTHNDSPVSGQDTIYSWIYRILGNTINDTNQGIFVLIVLSFIALLVLLFILYNKKLESKSLVNKRLEEKHFLFEYIVLVALIPNLTITDSEHFLFSVPLIAWIINYLFIKKPSYIFAIITILILFLYGGNLRELVGKQASRWMTDTGILGLGNIILIGYSILLLNLKEKNKTQNL